VRLVKGHGTRNDFLVLPDLDGALELRPEVVRALCDRRGGIGADGVLRLVRSANDPESAALAADSEFFMDYRNADGSVAEMCGNGLRVFFAYLRRLGFVEQSAAVATRGGIRCAWAGTDGNVTVQIGLPRFLADRPIATAASLTSGRPPIGGPGIALRIPNPHVVVELDDLAALADLDLSRAPAVDPSLPDGQNVEFVVRTGARRLQMRVYERGSGETMSCGTGICAAAVALAAGPATDPTDDLAAGPWQVDVPGGTCSVAPGPDGVVELTGPAVLVAEIEIDDDWLAGTSGAPGRVPR
jgi:diaminopimelate epimerase